MQGAPSHRDRETEECGDAVRHPLDRDGAMPSDSTYAATSFSRASSSWPTTPPSNAPPNSDATIAAGLPPASAAMPAPSTAPPSDPSTPFGLFSMSCSPPCIEPAQPSATETARTALRSFTDFSPDEPQALPAGRVALGTRLGVNGAGERGDGGGGLVGYCPAAAAFSTSWLACVCALSRSAAARSRDSISATRSAPTGSSRRIMSA